MTSRFLFLLLLTCGNVCAQGVSATTSREITQLFTALKQSNCEFSRNGSWHDAPEASAHLQRKYAYLQKKGLVTSTESFIALAATKSSMSGTPYAVRCGQAAPVASQTWFTDKLRALRNAPAAGAMGH
ncbi:DUF5329 domain-containing protein [Xanthomonas vesicatoria]|uniref:DUF5329 domain-containing protein n=1 Tax=Xanthomonas vesicatoria TaxID=56460 RepID=A0AAJ0N489_9XANT|nr:DUF5329 domain-containing protein [Xanthomonas vesicatoria]APO96121.1 hypothetical protein BI313_17365 [Xanthomonas vesicatoria]KHM92595.1 hypothetical protein OR60_16230 [Xanthomonas vesicatoria]KHM95098.1 hypothetical protein OR61_09730 [Xanthomonas vesicatoria]MCC8622885.1 DUF5329 domain-containing protein [Xanthomonas vesicatoria]MCC8693846.1 DUF5329 domain-containing protein [Xanthomonas vesicatoria]